MRKIMFLIGMELFLCHLMILDMMKSVSTILVLLLLVSCGEDDRVITPEKGSITEAVYASGKVKPEDQYNLYSTVSGILKHRFVEEGDTVYPGMVLMEIESQASELQASTAKAALELARENASRNSPVLAEARLAVITAKNKMINDSIQFGRYKKLFDNGVSSKAELENYELMYNTSMNNYLAASERYELTRKKVTTELKSAKNQYEISNWSSDNYRIQSHIEGKVYAMYRERGEVVTIQQPLAMLGKANEFLIDLTVDELDIVKLKEGQETYVKMDAYPDSVFKARIYRIYPLLDERTQTFRVEAKFDDPPRKLYPGLTVEANIIVDRVEDALIIPKSCLVGKDSVETESGKMIHIVKGLENLKSVQVLEGIDENTRIVSQK